MFLLALVACKAETNEEALADLDAMLQEEAALVRLYAAPIPATLSVALHPWFLVKGEGEEVYRRWEVWQEAEPPFEHVLLDGNDPDWDMGSGAAVLLGELVGEEAQEAGLLIDERSPLYPCRGEYHLVRGPNSNTYAAWMLEQLGWALELPSQMVGKDAGCEEEG